MENKTTDANKLIQTLFSKMKRLQILNFKIKNIDQILLENCYSAYIL